MKQIIFFLIFYFIPFNAHAVCKAIEEIETNSSIIDMKGSPSAIVGGHVNAITGNYREGGLNLYTPGSNPIRLTSSYSSANEEKGSLSYGWDLNLIGHVCEHNDEDDNYWITSNIGGSNYYYSHKKKDEYRIHEDILKCGVTNCTSGKLTASSRLINTKVSIGTRHAEMTLGSHENLLLYSRRSDTANERYYRIKRHYLPNQCHLSYDYGSSLGLSRITSKGKEDDILGYLNFDIPSSYKKNCSISVLTDDGRSVEYKIEHLQRSKKKKSKRFYVTSITSSNFPKKSFDYERFDSKTPIRLVKSSLPDGRFTSIQYNEKRNGCKSSIKGRVSALLAPVGMGAAPVTTHTFSYQLNSKSKPVGGVTTVIDALGYKIEYGYSRRHRIRTINQFSADDTLYRFEHITWGAKGTRDYTLLKRRSLSDGMGKELLVRSYEYDKRGNALKEHVEGNLTGLGEWNKQTTTYTYTDNDLVATENDGRKIISYVYHANCGLLYKKLISDQNGIVERHFFTYDLNGAQTLEIVDNGNSSDMRGLSGVTERRIKRIKSTPKGLPKTITESYLDISSGAEITLRKTVNSYSSEGYLTRKDVFNSNGTQSITQLFEYDPMGNLLSQTDPTGQTTQYTYDANGNCTLTQTPNQSYYTVYEYDFSNRLIHEEEVYADGKRLAKGYKYDLKGNRIASTDIYGNTTRQEYDAFNRVIRTIYPDDHEETTSYDELNNPVERCDKNGFVTSMAYTALGKPYLLQYPDGSTESCIYSVDGTMEEVVSTSGATTRFKHDYLGRKTEETKLLSTRSWKYNAFHLTEEVDPKGIVTRFFYDGAGRLIRKTSGEMEVRYVYDTFGRESEVWELYAPGCYRKTIRIFNSLDQLIEERTEDFFGTLFQKKTFEYDIDGNPSTQSIITSDGIVSKTTEFNAHKQPIKIVHPNGEETLFIYDYSQNVGYTEEIDPKGTVIARTKDVLGRVALEEIRSPTGNLLKKTSYTYDGMGHCIARSEDLIINDVIEDTITTNFEYDARGWEVAVIEAAGKPEQKITRRDFTPLGEIAHLYKPDGIILTHTYDLLGRLVEVKDSVDSLHQHYTYDLNDNILSVTDSVTNKTTTRAFDSQDRLINEVLENGLVMNYEHDPMGRVTKVILPDQTTINYAFNAHQLETISRGNNAYHYQYNLSGHLAKVSLPNGNGDITYEYDNALRPIKVSTSYTSQTIPEEGYDACNNLLKVDLSDALGEVSATYEYDPLHQVINEEGITSHQYAYDSRHNRTQKDEATYENDALNQLLKQDETSYTYDLNGNRSEQTSPDKNLQCEYDSLDRLTSLIKGSNKVVYQYDPFHRRTAKTVYTKANDSWIESDHEIYLYQGEQEIGTLDQLRILGPGISGDIGAAIAIEISQNTYLPLHDHRGNVIALIDAQENRVVETIRYSAYGEEQIFDAAGQPTATSLTPWRFSSKRVDPETGWSFFGRRYYDPEVGRWTTPDPLWFEDGPNLYCYVQNRPLRFVDPRGLSLRDVFDSCFSCDSLDIEDYDAFAGRWNQVGNSILGIRQWPKEKNEIYTVEGKKSNKIAIIEINGINCSWEEAKEHARLTSEMAGGCEVTLVYNQTNNIFFDLLECFLGYAGVHTNPVNLLKKTWDEKFKHLDDDGIILNKGHSQGVLHTRNALMSYSSENRNKIQALAIAPAAYIDDDLCREVQHFVSERDFIPRIDRSGINACQHTTTILEPHPDAAVWDHGLNSPTYRRSMTDAIQDALLTQGVF